MSFKYKRQLQVAAAVLAMFVLPSSWGQEDEAIGETGTDPRDFAPKFMPYYRYTELENGLEEQVATLFGLFAFTKNTAMTYEIPLAKHLDVTGTDLNNGGNCDPTASLPPGPGFPSVGGFEGDCEEAGVGDMNLRFMTKLNEEGNLLAGVQLDFPTATDPLLGSEQFKIGPMFAHVHDLTFWPAPGAFAAFMHFYFVDAFGDGNRDDVHMYLGRYFFMLPVHPSGIYLLPEVQFVVDFENDDHTSLFVGPEIGKLLGPGRIIYIKPYFGVDPDEDEGDRSEGLEVGYRYFF